MIAVVTECESLRIHTGVEIIPARHIFAGTWPRDTSFTLIDEKDWFIVSSSEFSQATRLLAYVLEVPP
jgi:hypothetical protein